METYRGYSMNVQNEPAPNGTRENTLLKAILNFLPVSGDTFIAAEHKHVGLYGPTVGEQIHCTDISAAIGGNIFFADTVRGYNGFGTNAPSGIVEVIKSVDPANTDNGFRMAIGNITATAGVFTRSGYTDTPVVLTDCGTLTDGGVLKILDKGYVPGVGSGKITCGFGMVWAADLDSAPPVPFVQAFFRILDGTITLISFTAGVTTALGTPASLNIVATAATPNSSTLLNIQNLLGDAMQVGYFLWYSSVWYYAP